MIIKTDEHEYESDTYGYGATLPTGERLWSCVIEPVQLLSAAECAQDLACGNIEIYSKNLLIETVTGMTKVRQYACTVKDDAIDWGCGQKPGPKKRGKCPCIPMTKECEQYSFILSLAAAK